MPLVKSPSTRSRRRPLAILALAGAGVLGGWILIPPAPAKTASVPPAPRTDPVARTEPAATAPAPAPKAPDPIPAPAPQTPEPAPAPAPTNAPPAWKTLLTEGKPYEARQELAREFASAANDARRREAAEAGIALNKKLLFTQPDERDVEFVPVFQGDNPTAIARRVPSLHGEPGLLFLLNGIKPATPIRAGARLRTTKGEWTLFVDKSLYTLWLCYEGVPYKSYPVCLGANDKTPATHWKVDLKNPKPSWTAPPDWLEKEKMANPIPYGHPKNPLGEYWIGLDAPGFLGFGIHGTNEPDTIGKQASNGCVRMLNPDVVELASCVWKGMDVKVED